MTDDSDVPASVRDSLRGLFREARQAVRTGDTETARARVETAARLVRTDVPPGSVRARLEHGLDAVERTAADEPLVASEYLESMAQLLEE